MKISSIHMMAMLVAIFSGSWSSAQNPSPPTAGALPQSTIVQSITAEGDWIRARADAYKTYREGDVLYAEARKRLAEAVDLELDNYLKYVETYFDRRLMREKKKMDLLDVLEQRKDKYGEYRKNARERLLKAILSDRERNGASIESGTSLNKLLYALAETPVAYGIDLGPSIQEQVESRLRIPPTVFDHIQIRSPGSTRQTFAITQQVGMNLSWWPDHLRQEPYDGLRAQLQAALDQANESADKATQIDRDALLEMKRALGALSKKYYGAYPPSRKKGMSTDELRQYLRTDEFLVRLNMDIQRMRDTGRVDTMGNARPFDIDRDGRDAQTLVTWMLQNGVKFGKAQRGDEAFYHQIFSKIADLYALVGE